MLRLYGKAYLLLNKMKQLILTFFLVILGYSLFFDKKAEQLPVVDEINYVKKEAFYPHIHVEAADTIPYFAMYNPTGWVFEGAKK